MWEPVTKLIEKYPTATLCLIIAYVAVTAVVAAYRWFYSAYSEAKKDYLQKLALYCEDVSDLVGQIAASNDYPKEKIEKFWTYYYGKLILVEDENMETVMVSLGSVLEDTTPQNYAEQREDIEDAVLAVSGACRDLIKGTWNLAIAPWRDLQAKRSAQDNEEQDEDLTGKDRGRVREQQRQKQHVTSK
jgi:hypothetical protein